MNRRRESAKRARVRKNEYVRRLEEDNKSLKTQIEWLKALISDDSRKQFEDQVSQGRAMSVKLEDSAVEAARQGTSNTSANSQKSADKSVAESSPPVADLRMPGEGFMHDAWDLMPIPAPQLDDLPLDGEFY